MNSRIQVVLDGLLAGGSRVDLQSIGNQQVTNSLVDVRVQLEGRSLPELQALLEISMLTEVGRPSSVAGG